MTLYNVVKRLTGPIDPVGETNEDDKRFDNLIQTINLIEDLLGEIRDISMYKDRAEFSMSRAGKRAQGFLTEIKEQE